MVWLTAPPLHEDPKGHGRDFLMLFNASADTKTFTIPDHLRGNRLQLVIDTSADSPNDIFPDFQGPSLISRNVDLVYKSLKVFVSDKV
jgi:glycogen operon protein